MSRALTVVGAAALGGLGYGTVIERNAFTLRRFEVPVLAAGARPLRLLHISDLHITAHQRRKQQWVRELARLTPDLVINTGDTLSDPHAVGAVLRALEPLAQFPAAFVPGNNDYYAPQWKNPMRYFAPPREKVQGTPLPWPQLASGMTHAGWRDLTHARARVDVCAQQVALAGTDDPHLRRARYEYIAGPAEPDAVVRIGVTHSPEPDLLRRFARDGYDLVLAGHTHGGQVRVPFGPAIVTNCGIDRGRARWLHRWDDRMWFHVSAGVGTGPYTPVRFCCRPEATLLRLVPRS